MTAACLAESDNQQVSQYEARLYFPGTVFESFMVTNSFLVVGCSKCTVSLGGAYGYI